MFWMGRLTITIDDDVEYRFREMARKHFGTRFGAIKKAVEEALEDWMKKN